MPIARTAHISWFDWSLLERHADIHRFVKALNTFRQRRDVVAEEGKLSLNRALAPGADRVAWGRPPSTRTGASTRIPWPLPCAAWAQIFSSHVMLNAYREPLTFEAAARTAGKRSILAALRRHRAGLT